MGPVVPSVASDTFLRKYAINISWEVLEVKCYHVAINAWWNKSQHHMSSMCSHLDLKWDPPYGSSCSKCTLRTGFLFACLFVFYHCLSFRGINNMNNAWYISRTLQPERKWLAKYFQLKTEKSNIECSNILAFRSLFIMCFKRTFFHLSLRLCRCFQIWQTTP